MAIGVWDGTIKSMVGGTFAVVTLLKLRAMPSIMRGVGDLAVEALIGGSRARGGVG